MPSFTPSAWHACNDHDWSDCPLATNSYAYILNKPDYYLAVAGMGYAHASPRQFYRAFDEYFSRATLVDFRKQITSGAARDGLKPIPRLIAEDGCYAAALFFSENEDEFDCCWYRQDIDDTWSTQGVGKAPVNRDKNGWRITDPRRAATDYPDFGGFFLVPLTGIELLPNFPIL